MKLLKTLSNLAIVVVTFLLLANTKPAAAEITAKCQAMLSLSIPDTEVTSETVVDASGPLPAHC